MTAPRPAPKHDTLVRRLVQILIKLNQGEKLSPIALSSEFNVDLRTIQRDLNERFAYLNLEKAGGYYSLDPVFLGKLSTLDIDRFAGLAGIKGLFPSFSDDFLRDIFDSRIQSALLVKGHNYEELHDDENQYFQQLEVAIASRHRVSFSFKKDEGDKQYADLDPYKLVNNKGIWYLAAKDNGKLKTFSFTKISRLMISKTVFDHDASIEKALIENDGIWMNETRREIILKVAKEVAGYFKRRKLIANQVIEKELENGALILSAKVGHLNQILPIVRYWIPHIQIISPDNLQSQLNQEISEYLRRTT